jgi:hypothetical protein
MLIRIRFRIPNTGIWEAQKHPNTVLFSCSRLQVTLLQQTLAANDADAEEEGALPSRGTLRRPGQLKGQCHEMNIFFEGPKNRNSIFLMSAYGFQNF